MRWDQLYADQVAEGFAPKAWVDHVSHLALGLTAEAGEVADLVKKSQYPGGTLDVESLRLELGDALWYLTALARQQGWSLADIAIANVDKLQARRGKPYNGARVAAAT
jgi:NTP pyrophosphatase (non-canonical NTP hydrolase)